MGTGECSGPLLPQFLNIHAKERSKITYDRYGRPLERRWHRRAGEKIGFLFVTRQRSPSLVGRGTAESCGVIEARARSGIPGFRQYPCAKAAPAVPGGRLFAI